MGLSGSKDTTGSVIGHWVKKGRALHQGEWDSKVQPGIAEGYYVEYSGAVPSGHTAWIALGNGRKYAVNNSMRLAHTFARVANISLDVLRPIAREVGPILLSAGKQAALNSAQQKFGSDPEKLKIATAFINSSSGAVESLGKNAAAEFDYDGGSDTAYIAAAEHYGAIAGSYDYDVAEGGDCGCRGGFIGAAEMDTSTARQYADSLNSKTKTRIMEDIIEAAGKIGLKATGDDLASKIKSIISQIPATDRIKRDPEAHRKTCVTIAKAINSTYGSKLIDPELGPETICQQITEILSSLISGMHTEFLAVYHDVRKVLKNLNILEGVLEQAFDKIKDRVRQSDDTLMVKQMTVLEDTHKLVTDEIKRQVELLKGLLNVQLTSSAKDLTSLLKNHKDMYGYIEKLDVKVGSDKFSKVLHDLLHNLGITANFALVVDRALKTVGLKTSEYASMTSPTQLREKIAAGLVGQSLDESALHEYLDAADLLYRNFYRNQDIAKEIQKGSKTGEYEMSDMYGGYSGGDTYAKSVMDKRVADRKKLRNIIFNTFHRQINGLFDRFVGALDVLSMKVGSEIPLSDQLDGLRQVLGRVSSVNGVRNKGIYFALIGYYNDAMSKSKKDQFVGDLRMISSFIDTILEMPMYKPSAQYFMAVQSQIRAMVEIIDKYSDEIAAKFGRGDDGEECRSIEKEGGADDDVDGGDLDDEPKISYKTTKSIDDAIRQFDYKYKVAQIRQNLSRAGKELDHFSEKYEKIVANSIAENLSTEQKKYAKLLKALDDDRDALNKISDAHLTAAGAAPFETPAKVKAQLADARAILESQWDAKKKFWATIEAVDTYMRVFTDGLIKNPADVKDIRSMLNSVDTIADWYSDDTGNKLAGIFDYFPSTITGAAAARDSDVKMPGADLLDAGNNHYYEVVGKELAKGATATMPGNPYIVTDPSRGKAARDQVRKVFTTLGVLKNLISVFVHIGSKFGGDEIRKKVFMTPAQIYSNLVDYIQASAFAQGFGVGNLDNTSLETGLPDTFNNNANISAQAEVGFGDVPAGLANAQPGGAAANFTAYDSATGNGTVEQLTKFKKRWGIWMRTVQSELAKREGFGFGSEDEYFVLMLKSIAAKIFTVTGMYDVLDRPYEFNGLSPIRMIVGGSSEVPKIEDGAVALYLRLPLLLQFYRELFDFNGDDATFKSYNELPMRGNEAIKISFVPDVNGPFAGLIRKIFRHTKYVDPSSYSDDDVKDVIRECNLIYQRMLEKYPQNTVDETYNELKNEINRRYGIVTMSTRNQFESEFGYNYDYGRGNTAIASRYDEPPTTEYAILPGEEDEEIQRPSAAQRLLGETFEKSEEKKSGFKISPDHKRLVYRFRCAIDKYFENPHEEYSFNHAIKSAQMKLKKESRDEDRFKIVAALVRGVDVYSKIDGFKYVIFHETVVSGLNTLSALHTLLARFQRHILALDVQNLQKLVLDYLKTAGAKSMDGLATHVVNKLTASKVFHDDEFTKSIVKKVLGAYENEIYNGGNGIKVTLGDNYALKARDGMSNAGVPRMIGFNPAAADDPLPAQNSLLGIIANNKPSAVENDLKSQKSTDLKTRGQFFMRYLFNSEFMMKDLLETLYGLGSDLQGLVEVKIENGKLFLNYGGVKSLVEELFQQVSYFIDVLRPHVNVDIISKYTDKLRPGSYYWLQEQLMEKIIIGRPASGNNPGYVNIDELSRKVSETYGFLTQEYDFNAANLVAAAPPTVNKPGTKSRNSFDKVFAEMIFYDSSKPSSGLHKSIKAAEIDANYGATSSAEIVDFLRDPYEALHLSGPPGAKVLDTRFAARFYQLYSWKSEFTFNRSTLFAFNQLVAKFVQSFYDPATSKMYSGLINQFANGTFNRAITDHRYTYPDVVPLVYLKTSSPSNIGIPMSRPLISTITDLQAQTDLKTLKQLLKEMLDYGNGANVDTGKLLTSQLGLFKTEVVPDANAVNINTTSFTVLALKYILAHIIDDLLNAPGVDPAAVPVASSRTILNAGIGTDLAVGSTVAQFRARYGNSGFPGIIRVVASTANARVMIPFRLTDSANATTGFSIDRTVGSPITLVDAGLKNTTKQLLDLYNNALRLTTNQNNTSWGSIAATTAQYFIYDSMKGVSQADTDVRVELFASILISLADRMRQGYGNSTTYQADINTPQNAIKAEAQKPISAYAASKTDSPSLSVKYDDLLATDKDQPTLADLSAVAGSSALVFAHSGGIIGGPSNLLSLPGLSTTTQGNGDDLLSIQKFGKRADPDADHVLFTSLAHVLKNIVSTRTTQNQALVYLTEIVADIPIYMKEKMRANLPAFRNLFKELIARCEHIKKFMMRGEIDLKRGFSASSAAGADVTPSHNPWPHVLVPIKDASSSDAAKARFSGILDSIIRGCQQLVSSSEQALKEIGDDPKFFETYQNSIRDYKSQYGVDPLMPMSTTLSILQNVDNTTYNRHLPIYSLGEESFKFMYGTRSLLQNMNANPLPEHNLGFAQTLEGFNSLVDTKMQVDKSRADAFAKTLTKSLRYIFDLKHIKGLLTTHLLIDTSFDKHPNAILQDNIRIAQISGLFTRDDMVVTDTARNDGAPRAGGPTASIYENGPVGITNWSDVSMSTQVAHDTGDKPWPRVVYAIAKPISDVLRLTESSNKDDQIKTLVNYIQGENHPTNALHIQNIIDLNIVPINVHALAREVPLINLYNYGYTYDRLIIELYYGLGSQEARKRIIELCSGDGNDYNLDKIGSAKDALVAMLLKPYLNMNKEIDGSVPTLYDQHMKEMLLGVANNGEQGRPKFLSDQVFGKAIFGELYESSSDYNEMGPAAGVVANGKYTKDAAIKFLTAFVRKVANVAFGTWANVLNAGNAVLVEQYWNALVRHLVDNQRASLKDVQDLIKTNALAIGKPFAGLVNPAAGIDALAFDSALIVKIAGAFGMWLIKKLESDNGYLGRGTNGQDMRDAMFALLNAFAAAAGAWTGFASAAAGSTALVGAVGAGFKPLAQNIAEIVINQNAIPAAANIGALAAGGPPADPTNADITTYDTRARGAVNTGTLTSVATDARGAAVLHWMKNHTESDLKEADGYPKSNTPSNVVDVLNSSQIQSVDVNEHKHFLAQIGRLRFDTVLLRNLIFIVNLYRSARLKLQRDLTYSKDIIQSSASITRPQLTEFFGNQLYAPRNQYGTNLRY